MNNMVSIIITTYNGYENLERAVESCLNQTYNEIEVIVVDDNDPASESRRRTEAVMQRYCGDKRVKYVCHEKNMNGSAARNTGIKSSEGVYIQFLDDDDYLFSEKIEKSIGILTENPACDGVITGVIAFGELGVSDLSGAYEFSGNYEVCKEWIKRFNALGTGSNLFITKQSIEAIGGFDTSYERMQDLEFIFRFCEQFKFCSTPERLIIKDLNSRPVKINTYKKHAAVINKFIDQFGENIKSQVGKKSADKWIAEQYAHLLRIALSFADIGEIESAKKGLLKYRSLTFSENLKCLFPKVWVLIKNNGVLKKFLRNIREGNSVNLALEEKLSKKEKQELNFYKKNFWKKV